MRETEVQDSRKRVIESATRLRPALHERTSYEPHLPQEEFVVPLLRREIESCTEYYATPPMGTAKAVDIGCGGQPFRELLRQAGNSYRGVDVNPDGGPPVDVLWAAGEPLSVALLQREPSDFLLCTEVIEHVADLFAAFANFALLLASGGRALITAPLVCLEAATVGKPIICFAGGGGMPEFVEEDCGIVVPYLDISAMADCIVALLDSPERPACMGTAARDKVTQRHDVSMAAPGIMEIIERNLTVAARAA
jgi:hypothetical protein